MTTTPTSGAADLPEALRSIQRFEVVDCIDEKHVPAVIPKPHGPWVRYEDHIAALAAGQATAAQTAPATQQAPQQEAQEPCPTCAALARTVMLDQVSFDRKPDCYGIRQITDDEGVEEWEDIRTSPDVAREESNDMMATGRGELYEVVPLWTTPQPYPTAQAAESVQEDALSDAVRVPLDSLHADAAYLIGRLRDGSMPYVRVIEIIRERIDAAKAAIRARASHGQAPAGATKPTEQQILEAAEKAGLWPNTVHSWIPAFHRYHKELAKAQSAQAQADSVTAVATLHQIMAAAMELHTIDNPDGEPEWAALRQCEVDVWRDRAEQVLKAAAAHGQAPATVQADSVQEDAARLDWLDQQCEGYGFQDIHEGNRWEISGPYANVRQAIDYERAARKQGEKQ